MKLIVGLGNPGREYERTRHNVGWWAVEHIAKAWGFDAWKKDGQALVSNGRLADSRVRLMKPQTYMNLSGEALGPYRRRETWDCSRDLLVIVDEVALPLGKLRLRARGSAGGHNGLKSIESALGTQHYARLRIGIRPEHEIGDLSGFVLGPFAKADAALVREQMEIVESAAESWLRDGIDTAMNTFNRNAKESE
ncbi:MAG TPA: aminoacyl-tRNA hydrolase [Gemmatimonadaceae bacterium]|nr:aminoacyl-tRNA hydrolase [Gemmatimonadaceae bacterium]